MSNVIPMQPNEACSLCGERAAIYADLDVMIAYRDEPDERYRAVLSVCGPCAEWLQVTRDTQRPPPPPEPEQLELAAMSDSMVKAQLNSQYGKSAPHRVYSPQPYIPSKVCECGKPAAMLTSGGYVCSACLSRVIK